MHTNNNESNKYPTFLLKYEMLFYGKYCSKQFLKEVRHCEK